MTNSHPWLLYGATGLTGRMILERAIARGHRPSLAGRDLDRVRSLATPLNLPAYHAPIEDSVALASAMRGHSMVLNVAGPFAQTAAALARVALESGVDYVDVSGELAPLQAVLALDAHARRAGRVLLAGAGFGVAVGELLAMLVANRLGRVQALRMAVMVDSAHASPGVGASTVGALAAGGRAIVEGRLSPRRIGAVRWNEQHPNGQAVSFASAPLAELAAVQHSLRVQDAVAGVPMPLYQARLLSIASPLLPLVMRSPAIRRQMENAGGHSATGASNHVFQSTVWVTGRDGDKTERAVASLGEGFASAADIAVAAVEALATRRPPAGSHTPGSGFGLDLLRAIPEIKISHEPK